MVMFCSLFDIFHLQQRICQEKASVRRTIVNMAQEATASQISDSATKFASIMTCHQVEDGETDEEKEVEDAGNLLLAA